MPGARALSLLGFGPSLLFLFCLALWEETSFLLTLSVLCVFCLLQILRAATGGVKRLRHYALWNCTGKSRGVIAFVRLSMHSRNQISVPFAQSFQRNVDESSQHVLPLLLAAVDGLARDDIIRRSLAHNPDCWQAFLRAIVSSLRLPTH